MKLTNKQKKLVKEYIQTLQSKRLNEEKVDIYEVLSEIKSKYPTAYKFFANVYSTSTYKKLEPILNSLDEGDLVERKKIEDLFRYLERQLTL